MKWLRIDANITRNPKVTAVKADGLMLYLRGLCYCAEHETDGVIPRHVVPAMVDDFIHMGLWITRKSCPPNVRRLSALSRDSHADSHADTCECNEPEDMSKAAFDRRRRRLVKRLVDAGLWHETPDGYAVNDYLKYQPERSEIEERDERRKAAARERKRRERAKKNVRDLSAECPNVTHVTPYTKRGYSLRSNPPFDETHSQGGTPALEGAGAPVIGEAENNTADTEQVLDEHGPHAIIRRLSEAKRMP